MTEKRHSIDVSFLKELDRFSFMVRKRVSSVYAGSRRSIHSGKGLDTRGYREYHWGDEPRTIDWNAYARTEKLYVREFEESKSLTNHILLDASNSMEYSSDGPTKFEYGAMLAIGFAYLVTKDNDKFAISTFATNVSFSQPKRGRKYLLRAIDRLAEAETGGKTSIEECVKQYEKAIRSRSLVIIISDFLDDPKSIESAIYRLSVHELIVIQVMDKTEKDLQIDGLAKLTDMESGEELQTYVSKNFQKNYQELLNEHVYRIQEACDHVGADFYQFSNDKPIFEAFLETLSSRRRW
jgi:uncharacterized protein (DUF58 family)